MKSFLFITLMVIHAGLFAQRIIENPEYSATTDGDVVITRIELQDTVTIIDFEVAFRPKWWIRVNANATCIQNSEGGEKLYVKRAEGIELNTKHTTPQSGINRYTLFFPPLDRSVESIDFLEETWKIYGIQLAPKKHYSFIPEELQGNWLRMDGSNEWVYGIYEDKIIYKNTIWRNVLIKDNRKKYQLSLEQDGMHEILFINVKRNHLLIGNNPDDLEAFSRRKSPNSNFKLVDDKGFISPIWKRDTAIYKGFIDGYHPKLGITGMVHCNDIIVHDQNSHLINIESDGSFYAEVPMIHPQEVYLRMLPVGGSVYLEPGETTFHYINLLVHTAKYRKNNDNATWLYGSLFMGETARTNTDLDAMDSINYFSYRKARDKILDMTTAEYKAYCLDIMDKELAAFEAFKQNHVACEKALQIKELEIPYRAYENILSYNMMRRSAYREKHDIPRNQREIPLEEASYEPEYFDFINIADLNNPISLVSGGAYNLLINRIRFANCTRPERNYYWKALLDTVLKNNIEITDKEQQMLSSLCHAKDRDEIRSIQKADTASWFGFFNKNKEMVRSVSRNAYNQEREKKYKEYFGISDGLVSDIMFAQSKCGRMRGRNKPFSEEDIAEIQKNITNDFIVDYLMVQNFLKEQEIQAVLEANKNKSGYVVNETPEAEGDKLFDAIMKKYKGKVVLVDFWATWCGPCRSSIEKMKPLKKELKKDSIAFVYITNETSPVETWNMMIPSIQGEHYRVNRDEWNFLSDRFNISGIPHYVLVNKNGKVVNNNNGLRSSQKLKELLNEYLD